MDSMTTALPRTPPVPALIVSRDERLLDELLRLAAAAGAVPEVVSDAGGALRSWRAASLVLVGTDLAPDLVRLGPSPRPGVHLVGWAGIGDESFRHAVALGAEQVSELPASDTWLLELLAESVDGRAAPPVTVGVLGGSGGAGATTFACALGLVAAETGPACLLDTDPGGPGVDRVLGFDRLDGARWEALEQTTGRVGARSLRDTLPRRHGLGVLTWSAGSRSAPQPFAFREALAAAGRGHPTVIVDLARSGPVTEDAVGRLGHVVVVVRPTLPGLAAAARQVGLLRDATSVGLVVRGARVDEAAVSRFLRAPVLTTMPDQRGLDEAVDLGRGPLWSRRNTLGRTAAAVLRDLRAA
jgi:secretion/DNA translocation related CpaE-like protein